jgi:UDP-N-acetylenolpyruvoylglucosamine reductase
MLSEYNDILCVNDICEILMIGRNRVYELLASGELKGFRVGNAAVSEKHAGFVVNLGGATASDVRNLLEKVSGIVFDKTGIRLEPEMRIW